jgi:hypothetical protein
MLRQLRTGVAVCVAFASRQSSSALRRHGRVRAAETTRKAPIKFIAAALAAAIALAPSVASATYVCPPKTSPAAGGSSAGPLVVGCIAGSALGLIVAALMKKDGQLTLQQAQTIAFSPCGVGFFLVANELKKKK